MEFGHLAVVAEILKWPGYEELLNAPDELGHVALHSLKGLFYELKSLIIQGLKARNTTYKELYKSLKDLKGPLRSMYATRPLHFEAV